MNRLKGKRAKQPLVAQFVDDEAEERFVVPVARIPPPLKKHYRAALESSPRLWTARVFPAYSVACPRS